MRTNFEDITFELTAEEAQYAKIISEKICQNIGKSNAVTSTRIIAFFAKKEIKLNPGRLRKIIQYIRISGMVENLVGCSKGYYVAANSEEAAASVLSLREQIRSIQATAESLLSQGLKKFGQDFVVKQMELAKKISQQ